MSKLQEQHTLFILPGWIKASWSLLIILLFSQPQLFSQEIAIDADQEPLNQVLIQVARDHNVQLSFDDHMLSGYSVTVHETFITTESAIAFLLNDLPLDYQKSGEVYIIFRKADQPVHRTFRLSGRIVDAYSNESLPYSHILINSTGVVTDFNGNFSFTSTNDSLFNLTISYLGYYIHDTILKAGGEDRKSVV